MGLEGTWVNELGSTLVIDSVSNGGLTGSYTTAVSSEACAKGSFVVLGRTDVDTGGTSLGWSVAWKNNGSWCYSVSSWAAQFDEAESIITAFWLLSIQTEEASGWASTNVGVDYFRPAGEARAGKTNKSLGRSHP